MKTHVWAVSLVLIVSTVCPLGAQSPPPNSAPSSASSSVQLSSSDLQQLVGPIALYSDPLLALILPASTYPQEIAQAAAYLNKGGTPDGIVSQNWDKSVQGLAHYPEVLQMMASNIDWTNQLGAAVLAQQGDVMAAVQTMRGKAQNLGNLSTTPQQTVTTVNNDIEITPANPQTVYVPSYDPAVVYVQSAPVVVGAAPWITFGAGFALGAWADYGIRWGWHGGGYGGVYGRGWGGWGYHGGWGGGGFICAGGFFHGSFGWSANYHSWSSSHYSWHRDWSRGGAPHAPYHPGHGGHLPAWNHHDNDHDHNHGPNGGHDHDQNGGHDHDQNGGHDHDQNGGHDHDQNGGHDGDKGGGHDKDHGSDSGHNSKEPDRHQHNSKENHDRPAHHEEHHAAAHHSDGGHHGGGGHRK